MNQCLHCNISISDKAKYCSEAHRKAYKRQTQAGQTPDKSDPDIQPGQVEGLTRTDALFEKHQPGYYHFGAVKVRKEECLNCGKEFKTTLKLLRQCSPKCMLAMVSLTV